MALEVPPPGVAPVATGSSTTSILFSVGMLLGSLFFAVAGQLTLKAAMNEVGRIGATELASAGDTYPFVGLSYVVVVLFARLFLHEQVTLLRWLGVIVVAIGIAIIGLSFNSKTGSQGG